VTDRFEWVDYAIDDPPVATLDEGRRVEEEIGYKLPADFIEVARHHQGQFPMPGGHHADGNGSSVGGLYHFHGEFGSGRLGWGDFINEGADSLLLAFCRDAGGNFFAFDYGKDPQKKNPIVVFWDHETRVVTKLADSFTDFLDQLTD